LKSEPLDNGLKVKYPSPGFNNPDEKDGLRKPLQNTFQTHDVTRAKKVNMHQQRMDVVNGNPLTKSGFEGKKFEVCFVKRCVEPAKQICEGQLRLPESEVTGRVNKPGFVPAAQHEIACPQIAMEKRRFFLRDNGTKAGTEDFDSFVKIDAYFLLHQAIANNGQDAVLDHKIDAVGFPFVGK